MKHYTEDDLILYYYGEGRRRADIEHHLESCATCATAYRTIAGTLKMIGVTEVPERSDHYGVEIWRRIRNRLPEQEWTTWLGWNRLALTGAAAVLVGAAFVAGLVWPRPEPVQPAAPQQASDLSADAGDRVRLAATGDHLERSERVLLDLINGYGSDGARVDVTQAQTWAAGLIDANRLYRQAAAREGDSMVAGVLDDLERNLLEIVHGPSTLTRAQLEQVRVRLDAAALLFRVRVLHDELREREAAPAKTRKTT